MNDAAPLPVICPVGVVEPGWLGQMFLDPGTHLFYQARGFTALDWRAVAPPDFVGSFVKVFRYFRGAPSDDPVGHAARDFTEDEIAVRKTMALDGVDVHRGERWRAGDVDVMQARITLRQPLGLSLFVGFAEAPAQGHEMPRGAGFAIEDGTARFGPIEIVLPKSAVALRVETCGRKVEAFFNDDRVEWAQLLGVPDPREPMVALFNRREGPRPTVPGYEHALKRTMDR